MGGSRVWAPRKRKQDLSFSLRQKLHGSEGKKEEYYGTVYQVATPAAKKLATFAHLAECWLSTVRGTVKESSYTHYYRNVHSYLVPAIGKYAISGIDSALVGCMKDEMLSHGGKRGKDLSEKTVSDIFFTLKMILLHASEQGYSAMNIAFINSPRKKRKSRLSSRKINWSCWKKHCWIPMKIYVSAFCLPYIPAFATVNFAGCVGKISISGHQQYKFDGLWKELPISRRFQKAKRK